MRIASIRGNLFLHALILGVLALPTISHGASSNCSGECTNSTSRLSRSQVGQIVSQAAGELRARGKQGTIAVVDRVGNVLAVYQTKRAISSNVVIRSGLFDKQTPPNPVKKDGRIELQAGLEELRVPATFAAISKAITAAYLSSEGNAFSTRTANQIIQESFNPREIGQPSGPLFGVQFSQLACGDLVQVGAGPGIGPRAAPLGLAADAGGLPLYIGGAAVGAIGVIADGVYGVDTNIFDTDTGIDEQAATAGTFGFEAPENRRADRIAVGGLLLRFSNTTLKDLASNPAAAPAFSRISNGKVGRLVDVPNFFVAANGLQPGRAFGTQASGIVPAGKLKPNPFGGLDAFVLTDGLSSNRFPPTGGEPNSAGQALSAYEVTTVLREGLKVANRARAQIRQPRGLPARVTLSVVDFRGKVLGLVRSRDAPVFGIDVSLQKARTAVLFSSPDAAELLRADPAPLGNGQFDTLGHYANAAQDFVAPPYTGNLFADGTAFSNRAIGNLARPSFPDGILTTPSGPLSKPFKASGDFQGVFKTGVNEWSPFNVGVQLDLVINDLAAVALLGTKQPGDCASGLAADSASPSLIPNGIQIFPGSVPIYKGGSLVGALGVSGDGVDQDDMVSFLGVNNGGAALGGAIKNAPRNRRADNVTVDAAGDRVNLRYVQCPVAPFLDSDEQTPCGGK